VTLMSRIVVAGDVIDDVIAVLQKPFRINTDTPAQIKRTLGGSAANTAVWLAHEGLPVDFFGQVGVADIARCEQDFREAGVTPHLSGDPGRETGSLVIVSHGEDRSMLSDRGANVGWDPRSISDAVLEGAAWLHLTGYGFFHHRDPASMRILISRARKKGLGVMVDASSTGFLADVGPNAFLDWISEATLLRCNEEEALALSAKDTLPLALTALATLFPQVVITRGSAGSLVWDSGGAHQIPAIKVSGLRDPTGAGDAFNAGVLRGLMAGSTLREAAEWAAGLAAQCVIRLGARP